MTVMLAVLALAGCDRLSGEVYPFAKTTVDGNGPALRLAITSFGGLPPDRLDDFLNALKRAARRRHITIVVGPASAGDGVMAGRMDARKHRGDVIVGWVWRVAQYGHPLRKTISGHEIIPAAPGRDPWSGVDDMALNRIAEHGLEDIALHFGELGYATRIAGLPPPAEGFKQFDDNAADSIDPDLIGPLELAAMKGEPGYPDAPTASRPVQDKAQTMKVSGTRQSVNARAGSHIGNVALLGVTGAPGAGNAELAGALATVLKQAGWPIVARPGKSSLRIGGRVTFGPSKGASQTVHLLWTIRDPNDALIGTVEQKNTVPTGSLIKSWGQSAILAARAAASGLFNLVGQVR
ncbi:MAG: hypothetical protein V6Z86_06665 [Hyphomicrobiales bacterium]